MKKILMWVGALTLAGVVAIALLIAMLAPRGRELDKSSREYACKLLDTAVKDWDAKAIQSVSSAQMLAAVKQEDLSRLLHAFSERLGSVKSYDPPRGDSNMSFKNFNKLITAQYVFAVTFEKAQGQVSMRLIQEDNQWKLLALNVNSPALLP